MESEKYVNVGIPRSVHRELRIFACETDKQIKEVLEKAIRQYIEQEKAKK